MTKIIKIDINNIDDELINEAAVFLKSGKLVAFPTETVYGLGANALDLDAFKKIFIAKGRPSDNPLIVHVSSFEQIQKYVKRIPEKARILADKFWPGPMTLIFESNGVIPKEVYGNLDKIGFRIPNHPIALRLLEKAEIPICAPSANLSGKPSPTKAIHVIDDLNEKIDMIIDGGQSKYGVESTVIDVTNNQITIVRPGGISYEEIRILFPDAQLGQNISETNATKKVISPGLKYKHYTPNAKVILVTGNDKKDKIKAYLQRLSISNYVVLTSQENASFYHELNFKIWGTIKNMETFSHNLFDYFRMADAEGFEYIFIEELQSTDIGLAVMNRINRAKQEVI